MNLGNKEKMIIGIVAAILLIGSLHMLVFRSNATQYRIAKDEYTNVINQYNSQQLPRGNREIYDFEYATVNYGLQFWEVFDKSAVSVPGELRTGAVTPEEAEEFKVDNFLMMYDRFVANIMERPDSEDLTELRFLNDFTNPYFNQPWTYLNELPETVSDNNTAVSDLLRDLKDTDAIIKETTEGSQLYFQKEPQYRTQLQQFGLDLARRDYMRTTFGDIVAAMYTLNRVNLVREAVPKTEVGIFDDNQYNAFLLDLFRLDTYEMQEKNAFSALQSFNEIIETCDRHGIDEMVFARLGEVRDIKWPPKEDTEEEEDTSATDGMFGEMYEEDFAFMFGGEDGEGGGRGFGGKGGEMFGFGEQAAVAAEEEKKDVVAGAIPIEVWIVGANSNIMNVIYEISNSGRHYHVDRFSIIALPQNDNKVLAKITVQALSYYLDGYLDQKVVEENLQNLIKHKNWLATEGGVVDESFTPDPDNAVSPEYSG